MIAVTSDGSKQMTTIKCETEENDISGLSQEENNLEDILNVLKLSGRYHTRFFILLIIFLIISSSSSTNYIFTAENVTFRCKYSNCNNTELLKLEQDSTLDYKCHKYELFGHNDTCTEDHFDVSSVEDCSEWVYDEPNSFVAEFNLGCEDWKRTLVGTIHSVGFMIGLLLIGPMSDKFGRKKILIFNALFTGVIGISKSMVTSYWIFIALELLEPMLGDSQSTIYTLAAEMVTTKNRPILVFIFSVAVTISDILMTFLAYISPNWRIYLMVLYTPLIFIILHILWLDESFRWLLSKGRKSEADQIIRKAAKMNNIVIDESTIINLANGERSSTTLLTSLKVTFSSRKLLIRFMLCICIWITALFDIYTLLINSVSLEGSKYINYGLTCSAGTVAGVILLFVLTKFNRKGPFILALTLTGVFCMTQSFVPKDYGWLSTLLYVCGKINSAITMKMTYLYTMELFPTYTRNTMLALCSSLGRIGAILAALTPLLLKYWSGLPSFLVGILSLVTALVVTLMPDTSEDTLPDNVKQAEIIGCKKNKTKLTL